MIHADTSRQEHGNTETRKQKESHQSEADDLNDYI